MQSNIDLIPAYEQCAEYTKTEEQFYPTPSVLAEQMLSFLDVNAINGKILEPSAGKGNLASAIVNYLKKFKGPDYDLLPDVVELNPVLRAILKEQNFSCVSDDFLHYFPTTAYKAIVMNPPFNKGDLHLLHAIEITEKQGGQIVCLLNANTLKICNSKSRMLLMQKLNQYDATIQYVPDAFSEAEHKASVNVAIIYIKIPQKDNSTSWILEGLKKDEERRKQFEEEMGLTRADNWQTIIVEQYKRDEAVITAFLQEYHNISNELLESDPLKVLRINCDNLNACIASLKRFYWEKLLNQEELLKQMTSKMQQDFAQLIEQEIGEYEFSEYNIQQAIRSISAHVSSGIEDAVMQLFEKFTNEHCWYPECSKNIHYYNGWKTNKAHKVGKKVILPICGAFASSWSRYVLNEWTIIDTIRDLEMALNYLDRGETTFRDPNFTGLHKAIEAGITKNIPFTYFDCTFYKKGTCHITFHEGTERILDRLNIFVGKKNNWLPPCYGTKNYSDMSEEEQEVVESFQGKTQYEELMKNPSLYLPQGNLLELSVLP